jgi:prepilin-type N-terminal cleavage/methylation domain-containing protein
MNRRGFTIVELVVVMTIMAILLTLGLVGFANSQANARDADRSADINAIAKGLEIRYTRGNPSATAAYITQGSYPSVYEMLHAEGQSFGTITPNQIASGYVTSLFPGTNLANFTPPKVTGALSATFIPMQTLAGYAAEDNTTINAKVTANVYVYEPINSANQVCINTSDCVRFNLYYKKESDGAIVKVSSKRQ